MKRNRCKKIAAALLCVVMGCTTLGQGFSAAAADATTSEEEVEINFAKALQMSLYFYDANKCGSGITGGNLEWRGDCHTNVINLKRLLNGKQNVWKYQNGEEKSDSDGREKDV